MTPEQIQAAIAAAMAQAAAQTAPAPTDHAAELASIRAADDLNDYGPKFRSDDGSFDGQYKVQVLSMTNTPKSDGVVVTDINCRVLESTNPTVTVGTERGVALFKNTFSYKKLIKHWAQQLSEAKGHVGPFSDAFYLSLFATPSAAVGAVLDLNVRTDLEIPGQKKAWTHCIPKAPKAPITVPAAASPVPTVPAPVAAPAPAPTVAAPVAGALPPGLPPEVLALLKAQGIA